MIRRILEEGHTVREVAVGFGISERTARKWLARYRAEGPSGLDNRSSCPRTVANRTAEYWISVMEMLRREYRLTAEEIAGKLKLARSTVAAWLTRRGLGRLTALEPKPPPRRYQRQHPGELIHLDIKKLAGFERVGHRITGDRRNPSTGAGYDCFHVAIDDATRLAYVEVLPDETRRSTTAFLVRALRWFRARGIRVERVMTDNGSGYVARLFRKALRLLGIRHIRTRPYTPKTTDVIDKSFFASTGVFSSRARVTLWQRAGLEVQTLPRSLYRRSSFRAPARTFPDLGPRGFQPATNRV
jgi:transposase